MGVKMSDAEVVALCKRMAAEGHPPTLRTVLDKVGGGRDRISELVNKFYEENPQVERPRRRPANEAAAAELDLSGGKAPSARRDKAALTMVDQTLRNGKGVDAEPDGRSKTVRSRSNGTGPLAAGDDAARRLAIAEREIEALRKRLADAQAEKEQLSKLLALEWDLRAREIEQFRSVMVALTGTPELPPEKHE
jgi:hypothetical protein